LPTQPDVLDLTHTGEGSSSPSVRLIIVRRRRQSQHEARSNTDGQQ
jgi:hypothetical protein